MKVRRTAPVRQDRRVEATRYARHFRDRHNMPRNTPVSLVRHLLATVTIAVSLHAAEPATNRPEPRLIASWAVGAAPADTLPDLSGHGNHGRLQGVTLMHKTEELVEHPCLTSTAEPDTSPCRTART